MILKLLSLIILLLTIVLSIIVILRNDNKKPVTIGKTEKIERKKIYLGAWVGGFWDNDTRTLDTKVFTDFEGVIGKKMAIANIYSQWSYLSNPKLIDSLNKMASYGWTPIISSNPSFFEECPKGEYSLYKTIAMGDCDEFLKDIAVNLRSYDKKILFRFAWEMNLPSMYWSVDFVNSEPDDFVEAWRHFYTILEQYKANNVQWVLSFNTSSSQTIPYLKLFPGDNYIDWVAIDGYNWGNTQDWGGWTSFEGVFRNSYNELTALTAKPVMLSEVNSSPTEAGGDKAEWIRDMLDVQLPKHFTQVEAVIFFNENKEEGEGVDWRLESSQEVTAVVNHSLKSDLYLSEFP